MAPGRQAVLPPGQLVQNQYGGSNMGGAMYVPGSYSSPRRSAPKWVQICFLTIFVVMFVGGLIFAIWVIYNIVSAQSEFEKQFPH